MNFRVAALACAVAGLTICPAAYSQGQQRAYVPEDLYSVQAVSDPQISPDGRRIAYVVKRADSSRQKYVTEILLAPVSGAGAGQVVVSATDQFDLSPRWSPDGRQIAFLQGEPAQIWTIAADTPGAPAQVTGMAHGVLEFSWSPDSQGFAFTAEVDDGRANSGIPGYVPKSNAVVMTRPDYRTGAWQRGPGGWYMGDRIAHIFTTRLAEKQPVQITNGAGGENDPQWSPAGDAIAFTGAGSIWKFDLKSKQSAQLARGHVPRFSPDGRDIAYVTNEVSGRAYKIGHVAIVPAAGGAPRDLTAEQDRNAADNYMHAPSFGWSPDGRYIYFTAADRGRVPLFRVNREGRPQVEQVVTGDNSIDAFTIAPQGTIAFTLSDMTHPDEVWSLPAGGRKRQQLTHHNDDWISGLKLAAPTEFTFRSHDGVPIQGWVLRPVNAAAGSRLPTILDVHGGPSLWFGHDAEWLHLWQGLTARGYMVLIINPRGSDGYGDDFIGKLRDDSGYGAADYLDFMMAVDYAVEKGWADPARLGVTGLSYGGFTTEWLIGHTTRFRAAVPRGGVSDWSSFFGTTDAARSGFYGPPWEALDKTSKGSPLIYAGNVTTPTLFSHGEADYRVPITQSEEMYRALQNKGVPTAMVRWPGQGHIPLLLGPPVYRVDLVHMMAAWFDRYIPGTPAP